MSRQKGDDSGAQRRVLLVEQPFQPGASPAYVHDQCCLDLGKNGAKQRDGDVPEVPSLNERDRRLRAARFTGDIDLAPTSIAAQGSDNAPDALIVHAGIVVFATSLPLTCHLRAA